MYAFGNCLAALLGRERGGGAAAFEVTMFDALVEWMGHPVYATDHTGAEPPRVGLSHPVIAPYDAYPTADGHEIVIGIQNDREWVRLATEVLDRAELATDPDYATNVARVRNRVAVDAVVAATMATLSVDAAVTALDAARIASARLNTIGELLDHPQLDARDRWRSVSTPVGVVRALRSAIEPGAESPMGDVPDLGQHTEPILLELGYPAERVSALRTAGTVT
jgi:crotonobetainyl-CoA:carnitine CoA-transferase CaiB-like acyl-CoA transferase